MAKSNEEIAAETVEEIEGTLIFDDEDIAKHLTRTEADILFTLHQKIFDGKKNNDMESKIKDRIGNMVDYKSTYLVRCDYNSVEVVEVDDPRPIGGQIHKDIFEDYPRRI